MRELAVALGYKTASGYQRYEDPALFTKAHLGLDLATRLADVLVGRGDPPIDRSEIMMLAGLGRADVQPREPLPRSNVAPEIIPGDQLVGARDFPIYTSAEGGRGQMLVSYEPIEYVKRPAPLEGVRGGFGMYVVGDSMEPAYCSGDMLLCHPSRPPSAGDDVFVVFENDDGELEGMVKRLVRTAGEKVVLRQHNPPQEFEVERSTIRGLHLIVGSYRRR